MKIALETSLFAEWNVDVDAGHLIWWFTLVSVYNNRTFLKGFVLYQKHHLL